MSRTAQSVWDNCLSFIKDNITPQAYKTWFEPIKAIKLTDMVLNIQVPSKFFYEWLEEHYFKLLRVALTKELGEKARLVYVIKMENTYGNNQPFTEKIPSINRSSLKSQDVDAPLKNQKSELKNPFVIAGIRNLQIESQLNPSYNFDNFLEGDSNRLARSAGMSIANMPGGTSFNPLFIFGGVGLGKTHLAHAIGVHIKDQYPEKTVLYISAEKFTQQYIESVKKNNRNDFIHFYQVIDVFIVDDIQLLSGKAGTQDVFFHIFNHLHQKGKQIILTSDRSPIKLKDFEQRLLSRFKWGLSAELKEPGFDNRMAIIKHKLYQEGVEIPEEIIEFLANNIKTNIRVLEGAIISLIAHSSFNKKEITLNLAKVVVGDYQEDAEGFEEKSKDGKEEIYNSEIFKESIYKEEVLESETYKESAYKEESSEYEDEIIDDNRSKDNNTPYKGILKLPKLLRNAFVKYLVNFDDYVKETKNVSLEFNIRKVDEGIELEMIIQDDASVEEVSEYLDEYMGLVKRDEVNIKDKIIINALETKVEILEIKYKAQVYQFKTDLDLANFKVKFFENKLEQLGALFTSKSREPIILNINTTQFQQQTQSQQQTQIIIFNKKEVIEIQDGFHDLKNCIDDEELSKEATTIQNELDALQDNEESLENLKKSGFKGRFRRFFSKLKKNIDHVNWTSKTLDNLVKGKESLEKLASYLEEYQIKEILDLIFKDIPGIK